MYDLVVFLELNVVYIIVCFLLRFNVYSLEIFDVFVVFFGRGVVMVFVFVDLDDVESKYGYGKEFESIFEGGMIGDFWKSRVFGM